MPTEDQKTPLEQDAKQPSGKAVTMRCGKEQYPLDAYVWKRESTNEWVLELNGVINGCSFTSRHTEPLTTPAEDVPGLPSLYLSHQPPSEPFGYVSDMGNFIHTKTYKIIGEDAVSYATPVFLSHQPQSVKDALEKAAQAIDDLASSGENKDDWTITRDLALHRASEIVRNLINQPKG